MESKTYIKIEHAPLICSEAAWRRSLHNGKLSQFNTPEEAVAALADKNKFPHTLQYRLVKVTEEVVSNA